MGFILQVLFAMDPSLQPRAIALYEKFASDPLGEIHLIPALIKFYAGTYFQLEVKRYYSL